MEIHGAHRWKVRMNENWHTLDEINGGNLDFRGEDWNPSLNSPMEALGEWTWRGNFDFDEEFEIGSFLIV